ncbi:MAG: DUF3489 domain-containing protein [Bryobacteraceae bacterium]|jgi:hypothetical protein
MLTFTIENETNNITAHATAQEAEAVPNAERFRNEAGLAKLAANWPAARLVEIYNSLPGVSPVKKFTDRKTAVSRIWKAIQSLRWSLPDEAETHADGAAPLDVTTTLVAPQTADVAPTEAPATRKATRSRKSPTATPKVRGPREGSKTAQVVAMLQRKNGATLAEIMTAMGWQRHTVRGFMAGAMKKAGYTVESFKPEGGERTYRISQ